MKEAVHRSRHPWLVGIAVATIAGLYFFLLRSSEHPEPGENVQYDIDAFAAVDDVATRYAEATPIALDMENPRALAVAGEFLYVAGENTVAVLARDGSERKRFPFEGVANCVAVAVDGTIYLGMKEKVVTLSADGAPQAAWPEWGAQAYLTAIALNGEDVYVADAGNRVVLRCDRAGAVQARLGAPDASRDVPGIEAPSPYLDVAVNAEGEIWVANPGKLGLERYRENGDIVTSWYRPALDIAGFSGCCNPTQIAFAPDGQLVTCEKGLARVKVYEVSSGEFVELVAGSNLFPQPHSLRDLVVDAAGRILVLDPKDNLIRIFTEKGPQRGNSDQPA